MELAVVDPDSALADLPVGTSPDAVARLLDSQRDLFHSQVDSLQRLVSAQCKLTGVNPLSQEMAAGALSIKIGKRPRDLLNPKAIKYMQSVFSIKDTIGKKETREISAICGATLTQVREFFSSQRSKVRKVVRLSREKAIQIDSRNVSSHELLPMPNGSIIPDHAPLNSEDNKVTEKCNEVQLNTVSSSVTVEKQVAVDPVNPKTVGETPSVSLQEETIPGVTSDDKKFLENIFNLMRKEQTFAGQIKLMEWVMQIHNSAILCWFLTKGGVTILATWLNHATLEEQTTVVLSIFKVLCHLPLHKALPMQISTILQSVNKLRFYRTSDISSKARFLLSRWSKLLLRSQNAKRSSSVSHIDTQKERFIKQRISEILSDGSWQSKVDIPDDILALGCESSEVNRRQLDSNKMLRLLPAAYGNSSGKPRRPVPSSKNKERRKVLLVEQPDRSTAGRNVPVAKAVPLNFSRPISADDIQKAKMRAVFMQDKYGKLDSTVVEKYAPKTDDPKVSLASKRSNPVPGSKLYRIRDGEDENDVPSAIKTSELMLEPSNDAKLSENSKEPSLEKLRSDQISWQKPAEMKIISEWMVGVGENSKEIEVQIQRNRREKETFYLYAREIPANPKEPWDVEMDFDDSLTPEIPTEQPPDSDTKDDVELPACPPENMNAKTLPADVSAPPATSAASGPDLELLAVLLKNPELVFALTSGQGAMDNAQTVALLDMLKRNNIELNSGLDVSVGNSADTYEPTSLPSPTPHAESVKFALSQNPQIRLPDSGLPYYHIGNRVATTVAPAMVSPVLPSPAHFVESTQVSLHSNSELPQGPQISMSVPQSTLRLNPSSQQSSNVDLLNRTLLRFDRDNAGIYTPFKNSEPSMSTKNFNPTNTTSIAQRQEMNSFNQVIENVSSLSQHPGYTRVVHRSHSPVPSDLSIPKYSMPVRTSTSTIGLNRRKNGLSQASASSNRISSSSQNYYDQLPSVPTRSLAESVYEQDDFVDEDEYRNWSDYRRRSDRDYVEPRSGFSRNSRSDGYSHGSSNHRNHQRSGRRWHRRDDD